MGRTYRLLTLVKITPQSLIKLMKACKENGVTEIQSGDFRLSFGTQDREPKSTTPVGRLEVSESTESKSELDEDKTVDEIDALEDDESLALLDDPFAFETAFANGELNEKSDDRSPE